MRSPSAIALVLQSTAVGGMETHCVDLAAEYVRRGLRVVAVVPAAAAFDDLGRRFVAGGAALTRLDTDARRGRAAQLASLARLAWTLGTFRPDVVHVQTGGATGGLAALAIARLATGAVVVLTEHDVPEPTPRRAHAFSRGLVDRLAHAIVAVSRRNAGLRTARIAPPGQKFASILNGVPIREAPAHVRAANRTAVRAALGIAPDGVVFGSVVRLADGKGLDDLLRAFALTRDGASQARLVLVGDGPLRPSLEALARELGIGADVCFAGHQADPLRYVDAFDAFVLAVPAGSMSIALLEAMARGVTPVITFCGPEEAVIPEETGLCAPPNDPARLARALSRLAADAALRDRLGAAAAAHVRRHFSVERVADDLLELYQAARSGAVPERMRADAPPDPRPGDRTRSGAEALTT